jgi:hypothetical protein
MGSRITNGLPKTDFVSKLFCPIERRQRSLPSGTLRYVRLKHSEIRGLTDEFQTVQLWTAKKLDWEAPEKRTVLPLMVYSVASDTVQVSRRTTPPSVRSLDPVRIQPIGVGVFYGGGLCPLGMALIRAKFALPSVCHQPTGWSIRHLLPVERWNVRDVPWRVAKLTREIGENEELHRFEALLPGRCLEQGLRELLQGYGLMTKGCVLVFRSARKRAHSEGVSEEEEEAKQRQGKRLQEEVADCGNPQSASTGELPAVLDEPEEVADFGNTQYEPEEVADFGNIQSSSTGELVAVLEESEPGSRVDSCMVADEEEKIRDLQKSLKSLKVVDGSDEARADISEDNATVDVKATKADNAAVRVGDWDRRLCRVMNVKLS